MQSWVLVRAAVSLAVVIGVAALTLAPASAQSLPDQPAPARTDDIAARQTFPPEYFTRYAPRNAADMLRQIPGFALHGTDAARGLGQASSNVLINGQRMPGKSEDALAQLGRIPASNVLRVEIIDAASLSLPGLAGQVANVVVRSAGLTGQFFWRGEARAHYADPLFTRFDMSLSGRRGPVDFTIGLSNPAGNRGGAGGPETLRNAAGAVIERRTGVLRSRWDQPRLSAAFTIDGPGDVLAHLNLAYRRTTGRIQLDETRSQAGGPDSQRLFVQHERGQEHEIGGDIEFGLGGGRLKLVGLDRRARAPLRQTSLLTLADGTAASGTRYGQSGLRREQVVRGEYGWQQGRAQWQLSAEAAFNRLDSHADLFAFDQPSGTFIAVPFPEGSGGVREARYETVLSYNRPLAADLALQLAAGAEFSRLATSGTNPLARGFGRPKGSLLLSWAPRKGPSLAFTLRRKVGQLDFGDFLARKFLADGTNNGSNTRLVPPQSWEMELEAKRDIGRWGTATLRLFDNRIEDAVDFIPLPGGGEARGNIDHSRSRGLGFNGSTNFDTLGWKGTRIDLRFERVRSRLRDPLTGLRRPVGETRHTMVEIDFRHDVPGSNWAFGGHFNTYRYEKAYRSSEIARDWEGPNWAALFVENKDIGGLTVTARATNLANARARLDRQVYAGPRSSAPLLYTEHRSRLIGPIFSLTVKGNF